MFGMRPLRVVEGAPPTISQVMPLVASVGEAIASKSGGGPVIPSVCGSHYLPRLSADDLAQFLLPLNQLKWTSGSRILAAMVETVPRPAWDRRNVEATARAQIRSVWLECQLDLLDLKLTERYKIMLSEPYADARAANNVRREYVRAAPAHA